MRLVPDIDGSNAYRTAACRMLKFVIEAYAVLRHVYVLLRCVCALHPKGSVMKHQEMNHGSCGQELS